MGGGGWVVVVLNQVPTLGLRDTNPFSLFQSPSFCLTDSHLKGGEGEKISDQ